MLALGTLVVLAWAALEGTFSLYLGERQRWGPGGVLAGFTFLGLVGALVQGGLVRRLVPRWGEPRVILAGVALLIAGFVGLAVASGTAAVLIAALLVGAGQGLATPSINGLLSRITPEGEQGAVFGTLASTQTLARMINYLVANELFGRGDTASPFWEGAVIATLALGLGLASLPRIARIVALGNPGRSLEGNPVATSA